MSILKVFISHSHQDNQFCQQLVQALRQAGADVWMDEHDLGTGHLLDTIERELRERLVFILILSPAALASQWVHNEAVWAFNRTQRDPDRIFLPVLVERVEPDALWLFIETFRRIEAPGGEPYTITETIQRVLRVLSLVPQENMLTISPIDNAEELVLRARALGARRQYKEAAEILRQAVIMYPHSLPLWSRLGHSLSESGQADAALEAFNRALALDSVSAPDWSGKGTVFLGLRKYDDAKAALEQALAIDRNYAPAWESLGNILAFLNRLDEALAAFEMAIALNPQEAIYWGNKGFALVWMRHYRAALQCCEISLKLAAQSPFVMRFKAWALLGLGEYEEALMACQDALRYAPDDVRIMVCCVLVLQCMGREVEAQMWEAKAVPSLQSLLPTSVPFVFEDGYLVALRRPQQPPYTPRLVDMVKSVGK